MTASISEMISCGDESLISCAIQESFSRNDTSVLEEVFLHLDPTLSSIDLSTLVNNTSDGSPLLLPPRHHLDSREILSSILSCRADAVAMKSLHLRVLRLYLRELLISTLHRRQRRHDAKAIPVSMAAWGRDLLLVLDDYCTSVERTDASPEFSSAAMDFDGEEAVKQSEDLTPTSVNDSDVFLCHFFQNAIALVDDINSITILQKQCAMCTVRLYGALRAARPLNGAVCFFTETTAHRIRDLVERMEYAPEKRSELSDMPCADDLSVDAESVVTAVFWRMHSTNSACGDPVGVGCTLLRELLSRLRSNGDEYLYADGEKGVEIRSDKQATLSAARRDVMATLHVWGPAGVMGGSPVDEDLDTLTALGALMILFQANIGGSSTSTLLSTSPESLFYSLGPLMAASVQVRAAQASLEVMLLLECVIRAVPKFSLGFLEDASGSVSPTTTSADSYQTRRYKTTFDLLKQLISISALSPVELHRSIGRYLTIQLFDRLAVASRVRMLCSSLCLCPFGSVARTLLDKLVSEWRVYEADESTEEAFEVTFPTGLVDALFHFVSQINAFARDFVDPLIVGLNFFRVMIRTDRRKDADRRRLSQGSVNGADCNAWQRATIQLRGFLPSCRKLLQLAAAPTAGNAIAFSMALSPVDTFALESSIDDLADLLEG